MAGVIKNGGIAPPLSRVDAVDGHVDGYLGETSDESKEMGRGAAHQSDHVSISHDGLGSTDWIMQNSAPLPPLQTALSAAVGTTHVPGVLFSMVYVFVGRD